MSCYSYMSIILIQQPCDVRETLKPHVSIGNTRTYVIAAAYSYLVLNSCNSRVKRHILRNNQVITVPTARCFITGGLITSFNKVVL